MARTTICGLKCTLFLDYDCNEGDRPLKNLPNKGKIEWLEKRLQMIMIRPFQKIYNKKTEAYNALHIDYGLGRSTPFIVTTSVIMNIIEALGAYLRHHKKGEEQKDKDKNFRKFIRQYMREWAAPVKAPRHGNMKLDVILWKAFRNALTHEFAIKDASLEDLPGHQRYDATGTVIKIDGTKFFRDFVNAEKSMFKDVRTKTTLQRYFLARFRYTYRC